MASAPAEGAQGTVVPRHIFGLKGDVRNNVHYTDETVVVFPCGATTVVHNTVAIVNHAIDSIERKRLYIFMGCGRSFATATTCTMIYHDMIS